ncbi:hypothetical protein [Shimazuella alba]|uniref:Uncharacterized protein n=1 Tax=Shimazuella alba TaxID=2690964 RepID=A0A6I4VWT7_9BACL|nr:hypothetical protein [Shimazuella alba]MXQ55088.1 hypothetical protein [Shimazuella alba]
MERYGFRPTVIERAPKLREGDNGVDIREQEIEVAKRMGIMSRIQKKASDTIRLMSRLMQNIPRLSSSN